MINKKEALILGLVAIGGLGIASGIASDSGEGGAKSNTQRFGRILGSDGKKVSSEPAGSYTYNIAGSAPPSFPAIPSFSLEKLLPMPKEDTTQPKKITSGSGGVYVIPSFYQESAKKAGLTTTQKDVYTGMSSIGMKFAGIPVQNIKSAPAPAPSKKSASTSKSTHSKGGYASAGSPHLGGWG